MMKCVKIIVSGTVQGVFFRSNARNKANELEITGYAKNLKDGTVEIMAQGDDAKLKMFMDFLSASPKPSKVKNLTVHYYEPGHYRGFEVR
jgi:acylphosphatase